MEVLHRGPARYEVRQITFQPIGSVHDSPAERDVVVALFAEATAGEAYCELSEEDHRDGTRTTTFAVFWRDDTETT